MSKPNRSQTHIPPSTFFERVVPALLVGMAVLSVGLIVVSAAVVFGIVPSN